jgi:poly-gamma-glutamate capsule biosynthesis protein CapA/YwtB (metallophosphatase superfamily)
MCAQPFTLSATGESMCTRRISCHQEEEFLALVDILRNSDAAHTNLETRIHTCKGYPMPVDTLGLTQSYQQADPFVADELKWMGFNLIARSNNHGMDYGPEMLSEEAAILDKAGLIHAGAGNNLSEATMPVYWETSHGRAALISVCTDFPPHCPAGEQRHDMPGRPGINPIRHDTRYLLNPADFANLKQMSLQLGFEKFVQDEKFNFLKNNFELAEETKVIHEVRKSDLERNLRAIKEARRAADYVLLHIHQEAIEDGGPPERIQRLVRTFIDHGVDVVIGDGPHELQGVEIYKGKPIFYSLGNFFYQSETIKRFPFDIYERNGLDQYATPQDVLDYREKTRSGKLKRDGVPATRSGEAYMRWFDALVGHCSFDGRNLVEVRLYPIWNYNPKRSQRGRPMLAKGDQAKKIIDYVAECSAQWGTVIEYRDGIGYLKNLT